MKKRAGLIATLWIFISAFITPTVSSRDRFLIRIKPSAQSIEESADRQGLRFIRSFGPEAPSFLVAGSDDATGTLLERIQADPDVEAAEKVLEVRLPEFRNEASFDFEPTIDAWLSSATGMALLANRSFVEYYGQAVWQSYVDQPAMRITHGARAHRIATGRGVTVAIIDTRIEPHPVLETVLDTGYDFMRDGDADADLEQTPLDGVDLQQGTTVVINVSKPHGQPIGSTDPLGTTRTGSEQEYALGHGTMIAGIVHLIAPEARIMPLNVFARNGSADTARIVRAIYYAVEHGARVINMSFAATALSPELLRAVNYATRRGVVCVAAAGNQARATMVYPASLANVLGVASTDEADHRSAFSNFGPDVAKVAAPGEGIVTTYLDGAYAAGWGTSFSGAVVSGGAALLLDASSALDQYDVARLLSRTAERTNEDREQRRVDFWRAVRAVPGSGPGF
jgi:subtilisin family serine protease